MHLECNRGTNLLCLDWSEICDGHIDCLNNGIDEEHCWQLQINTQVNKSDNESDRILWDPTIRRKSYRNPGDDPRDGSVVLDPIGSHSKIR